MPSGVQAPPLVSLAVRGLLVSAASFCAGVLVGDGAVLTSKAAIVAAALAGAGLLLALFVEMLMGGEIARLGAKIEKLDKEIGDLHAQLVLTKGAADAAHKAARESLSGADIGDPKSLR